MPAVILIIATPILLVVALGARFGGNSTVLNFVDYTTVRDKALLNRWAGNRLIFLPVLAAISGTAALRYPTMGIPLIIGFFFSFLIVVFWIAVGSGKFTR